MVLRSRQFNPLTVAGVGGVFIAILIATALNPPGGRSGGSFALSDSISVAEPVAMSCPDVAGRLPALPAAARAEVVDELESLERQIVDADVRMARYPEQAVDQLNDIFVERQASIERIISAIAEAGGTAPGELRRLARCSLERAAAAAGEAIGESPSTIETIPPADKVVAQPAKRPAKREPVKRDRANGGGGESGAGTPTRGPADTGSDAGDAPDNDAGAEQGGGSAENGGNDQAGGGSEGGGSDGGGSSGGGSSGGGSSGGDAAVQGVRCPSVQDRLPAVPAAAAAEVDRNLAELRQQIAEANARIAEIVRNPVGDPNFIQNTVLGPLRDRRIATLDRIAIAIGRVAARPTNLAELAPCALNG